MVKLHLMERGCESRDKLPPHGCTGGNTKWMIGPQDGTILSPNCIICNTTVQLGTIVPGNYISIHLDQPLVGFGRSESWGGQLPFSFSFSFSSRQCECWCHPHNDFPPFQFLDGMTDAQHWLVFHFQSHLCGTLLHLHPMSWPGNVEKKVMQGRRFLVGGGEKDGCTKITIGKHQSHIT